MAAPRRPDIDLLRAFAVAVLFVFHTGKVFDRAPFYQVKNGELSAALNVFTGFIHLWHMPLFFALAGWSAASSLSRRGSRAFVVERLRRLMVPFVFGCVALCPALQYVYVVTARGYAGTFLDFVPLFFSSFAWFSWSHLWFLAYLFTFTMLYLPVLERLVGMAAAKRPPRAVTLALPLVPLLLTQALLRPLWPGWQNLIDDWANFAWYSTFFLVGAVTAARPAFGGALMARWRVHFVVAIVASLAMFLIYDVGHVSWIMGHMLLTAFAGYGFTFGLLGWARERLTTAPRWLPLAAEAAFPVYVLHQVFIVLPGWWVVGLPWGISAKWALLLAVSVVGTLAAYGALVRPWRGVRWLFGMPPPRTHRLDGSPVDR